MLKSFSLAALVIGLAAPVAARASYDPMTPREIDLSVSDEAKSMRKAPPSVKTVFSPFTGKVNGDNVRVRLQPDLDSRIISELNRGEHVSIVAQEGNFYCVEPSELVKAYIFRSFVLDGVVEGSRINVRLEPDLEAPVIGHVNSGDRVDGEICSSNRKWLEIAPPASTRFYVSKEFIDYAGDRELKAKMAKRKETVGHLLETAELVAGEELAREFEEIDFERVKEGYLTIIHEYSDFPKRAQSAKEALAKVQEEYLEKRIAYLEEKAALVTSDSFRSHKAASPYVQMWATIEQGLYTTWAGANAGRSMDEYYEEQCRVASSIEGTLEPFRSSVNNKPGDYILKGNRLPVAYIYSTVVDLNDYVGKKITVVGSPRSKNNFAFPAYFVHKVEKVHEAK